MTIQTLDDIIDRYKGATAGKSETDRAAIRDQIFAEYPQHRAGLQDWLATRYMSDWLKAEDPVERLQLGIATAKKESPSSS